MMNEGLVVVVRSLIAFATLFIFTRTLGRQQLSQLTFFDYVLGITIGSMAATLSVDLSSRAWPHWVGLVIWVVIVILLQRLRIQLKQADRYLGGDPVVVIMRGKLLENNLKTVHYTLSDLLMQLRDKDVFDLSQVDFAVLETNGALSIQLKPEHQTVTRQDMNVPISPEGVNTQVIYSGLILAENLQKANIDQQWLLDQLKAQGINSPSEVFLATFNPTNQTLYVDKYEDG